MAAQSSPTLLLVVLVLSIFADPCDTVELRCQCVQTHSDFIALKFIKNLQLIPPGPSCERTEIIVTLRNEKLICVDPEADWVMTIIKRLRQQPRTKSLTEPLTDGHTRNTTSDE